MNMANALFYAAAAVAVVSTAMVITRRNAVHALLYLVVSFLAVAVVFYGLGAPFVAALEVIIYAGAIMVLFVFVVMMVQPSAPPKNHGLWRRLRTWAGPAGLSLILFGEFVTIVVSRGLPHVHAGQVAPQEVGLSLFSTYLLGVEMAAVLLMGAVVGAFRLGHRRQEPVHRFFVEEESK
jgi:NADH-quinone oxidoreductase subunit J